MTTLKYIATRADYPAPFTRYTPDGIEFRGGPVPVNVAELEELTYSGDFHCQTFDLGSPTQLAEYTRVMDMAINRAVMLYGPKAAREPQWNPHTGSFFVILRWVKPWAEPPRRLKGLLGRA